MLHHERNKSEKRSESRQSHRSPCMFYRDGLSESLQAAYPPIGDNDMETEFENLLEQLNH